MKLIKKSVVIFDRYEKINHNDIIQRDSYHFYVSGLHGVCISVDTTNKLVSMVFSSCVFLEASRLSTILR